MAIAVIRSRKSYIEVHSTFSYYLLSSLFKIHLCQSIFAQRALFPIHPYSPSPSDTWNGGLNCNRAGAQKFRLVSM